MRLWCSRPVMHPPSFFFVTSLWPFQMHETILVLSSGNVWLSFMIPRGQSHHANHLHATYPSINAFPSSIEEGHSPNLHLFNGNPPGQQLD